MAAFCVVALPWYIVSARRNPDFIRIFIFQHNFERYLTPIFQHRQPFWFFIPITLLAVIPWLAFLIPAASDGINLWCEQSWHGSPGFFFACWAVFPIIFFSFSQSKLPSYILPAIPDLALVLAVAAARLLQQGSRGGGWTFAWLGVTWVGLGIAGIIWLRRLSGEAASAVRSPILFSASLTVAGGLAILLLAQTRQRATIWISLFLVFVCVEVGGLSILTNLDSDYSARVAGTILQRDLRPDRLFEYQLPRAWQYGLAFYLKRPLPDWSPEDYQAALVLTTRINCAELQRQRLTQGDCSESQGPVVAVPVLPRPSAHTRTIQ